MPVYRGCIKMTQPILMFGKSDKKADKFGDFFLASGIHRQKTANSCTLFFLYGQRIPPKSHSVLR
jgi:hypothetical protein